MIICILRLVRSRFAVRLIPALLLAAFVASASFVLAQRADTPVKVPPEKTPPPVEEQPETLFAHSTTARYLISGQANVVFQGHGPFHSPYSDVNSFLGRGEYKTSLVETLFLGFQVQRAERFGTDLILDIESTGGRGDSDALGLAGFTNLDVVRNPNIGSTPYISRIQLHQTIGLSSKMLEGSRTPFALATRVPERRIELHIGKMGVNDYLDQNSVGTDSHLQFLNWTVDQNGAWDYAADTRGYTYAAVAEYIDKSWSARYAMGLMPTVANGIDLDWNPRRASGQNVELEYRRNLLGRLVQKDRRGAVRVLCYVNHAHMGLYRDAINAYLTGVDTRPDITRHEKFGAVKYGFGLNAEQEWTPTLRVFARLGWNEGQHESFAYTEVDQTVEFGGDLNGRQWGRANDKAGVAFTSNAIKRDHQEYLRLGGFGFLLGDGRLNYGREDILEAYYNLHAWKGVFYGLDTQFVEHPGYNRDRGPALVSAVRMHLDF